MAQTLQRALAGGLRLLREEEALRVLVSGRVEDGFGARFQFKQLLLAEAPI